MCIMLAGSRLRLSRFCPRCSCARKFIFHPFPTFTFSYANRQVIKVRSCLKNVTRTAFEISSNCFFCLCFINARPARLQVYGASWCHLLVHFEWCDKCRSRSSITLDGWHSGNSFQHIATSLITLLS